MINKSLKCKCPCKTIKTKLGKMKFPEVENMRAGGPQKQVRVTQNKTLDISLTRILRRPQL